MENNNGPFSPTPWRIMGNEIVRDTKYPEHSSYYDAVAQVLRAEDMRRIVDCVNGIGVLNPSDVRDLVSAALGMAESLGFRRVRRPSAAWTRTPWGFSMDNLFSYDPAVIGNPLLNQAKDRGIAIVRLENDGHRIADCVNNCSDIPTPSGITDFIAGVGKCLRCDYAEQPTTIAESFAYIGINIERGS